MNLGTTPFEICTLSERNTPAYAMLRTEVMHPHGPSVEERIAYCTSQLARSPTFGSRIHVVTRADDACALAALTVHPFEGTPHTALLDWSTREAHRASSLHTIEALMRHALPALAAQRPDEPLTLRMRLDLDRAVAGLPELLGELGWTPQGERYEFKTPVQELPLDWRGPLTWRSMAEVGRTLAAETFERAGQGPDWEEGDEGGALIDMYLSNEELTCDPSCVEVGFDAADAPVALLIAQTNPSDGWCTMTFMGVAPEARGKGYGRWVHRRGFELLRQQGGTLYHGGTSAHNHAMRHLFASHGCRHHAHLLELAYSAPPIAQNIENS